MQWRRADTVLLKNILLTLFERVRKGYKGFYSGRSELETKQNCNILTPTLMVITAFLSRSPRQLNWGPGGPASLRHGPHSSIFSPTDLNSNCNCSIRGLRAPSAGCWFSLLHLISNWLELLVHRVILLFYTHSIQPVDSQGYPLETFDQMHLFSTSTIFTAPVGMVTFRQSPYWYYPWADVAVSTSSDTQHLWTWWHFCDHTGFINLYVNNIRHIHTCRFTLTYYISAITWKRYEKRASCAFGFFIHIRRIKKIAYPLWLVFFQGIEMTYS